MTHSPTDGPITSISEPGVLVDKQEALAMRREVAHLLERQSLEFPGSQPVSFLRRHLDELRERDYYLCEKSDGIRYLLYLGSETHQECIYLIDRKGDFWYIPNKNLHFPLVADQQAFHRNTILDGELVMDRDPADPTKTEPKFLVFDCLVIDGENVMKRTLDRRLGKMHQFILTPYLELFRQYPQERPFQPFSVEAKELQLGYGIKMVLKQIRTLRHGNDGLVWTCRSSEYRPGTDPHILKWKPAHENTVDFRLVLTFPLVEATEQELRDGFPPQFVDYDTLAGAEVWAYHGGGAGSEPYQKFADLHIAEDEWEEIKGMGDPVQDRVVECYKDELGRWRLSRFRDDKRHGNHISVIHNVLESIEDPVTEQDLLAAASGIKGRWKSREKAAQQQPSQQPSQPPAPPQPQKGERRPMEGAGSRGEGPHRAEGPGRGESGAEKNT